MNYTESFNSVKNNEILSLIEKIEQKIESLYTV